MDTRTKICNKCGIEKPTTNFPKASSTDDGLYNYCKDCNKLLCKSHQKKNQDKNRDLSIKEIYERTPSKKCSRCKEEKVSNEFSRNNSTKSGLSSRCKLCCKNLELVRRNTIFSDISNKSLDELLNTTPTKSCSLCNIEKESSKFYRSNFSRDGFSHYCIDCSKLSCATWRKENPDKNRESSLRYLARKKNLFYKDISIEELIKRDGQNCSWCGKTINEYHVDHVRPLHLMGIHTPENLVLSCMECNTSKGHSDPREWVKYRELIGEPLNPSKSALYAIELSDSGFHENLQRSILETVIRPG